MDSQYLPYLLQIAQFTVTCAMLITYKMSSTSFSTAPKHTRSLRRTFMSLPYPAGVGNVSAFLSQNNKKLYLFLYALQLFYELASSRTS